MFSVLTEITLNDCFSLMIFFFCHDDAGCENDFNLKCVRLDDDYIVLTSGKVCKKKTKQKNV